MIYIKLNQWQSLNDKSTSEVEEINKTITLEIRKIKEHIIPEIKNEINVAGQKTT